MDVKDMLNLIEEFEKHMFLSNPTGAGLFDPVELEQMMAHREKHTGGRSIWNLPTLSLKNYLIYLRDLFGYKKYEPITVKGIARKAKEKKFPKKVVTYATPKRRAVRRKSR